MEPATRALLIDGRRSLASSRLRRKIGLDLNRERTDAVRIRDFYERAWVQDDELGGKAIAFPLA
jgi:hypothetical protein